MDGFSVGIITISDKGSIGARADASGPVIRDIIKQAGGRVEKYVIVPDEKQEIKEAIIDMSDSLRLNLILTTGGTGFSERDITPEATMEVVEKCVPGIPEAMRAKSLLITPKAMLSRAQAGIRKGSLIINLPGSPKGAEENLEAILPALKHGIEILTGRASECGEK
ncbi:MAG TPA: MogA/MoaB family molybdenum cofactor biosynthesis protein [Bacillota bacterium]|nr:MogA/MoaB family molybdenum cofactor biosynthesis protein [Bacillota bacterium]